MCGYRGYYTDRAMTHFDNNRLHSESKTNNRKRRKEAGRVVQKNIDDGQTNNINNTLDDVDTAIESDEQAADDYHETNPADQPTAQGSGIIIDIDNNECISDDNYTTSTSSSDESSDDTDDETNHMNKRETLLNPDTRTNEILETNDDSSDEEYSYYNPRDKRRWKEE